MADESPAAAKPGTATSPTIKCDHNKDGSGKFEIAAGYSWSTDPVEIKRLEGKYVVSAKLQFNATAEAAGEIALSPAAEKEGGDAKKDSYLKAVLAAGLKQLGDTFDYTKWKFGDWAIEPPSAGTETGNEKGESVTKFEVKLSTKVSVGPADLDIDFIVIEISSNKAEMEFGSLEVALKKEFTLAKVEIIEGIEASIKASVAGALTVQPNWVTIGAWITENAGKLGNAAKTGAQGLKLFVGAVGVVESLLIGGAVLTVVMAYMDIKEDTNMETMRDGIPKWIAQAEQDFIGGLLADNSSNSEYYQRGINARQKAAADADTYLQQQNAGVHVVQQPTDPNPGTLDPDYVSAWNDLVNQNASKIKAQNEKDFTYQVELLAWQTWARANPNASIPLRHEVFEQCPTLGQVGKDNFAYTQWYTNEYT